MAGGPHGAAAHGDRYADAASVRSPTWPVAPTGPRNASPSPGSPQAFTAAAPNGTICCCGPRRHERRRLIALAVRFLATKLGFSPMVERSRGLIVELKLAARFGRARGRKAATSHDPRQLHPADQQFALVDHLRRQMIVQVDEQFFVADHLLAPGRRGPLPAARRTARARSRGPFQSMSS